MLKYAELVQVLWYLQAALLVTSWRMLKRVPHLFGRGTPPNTKQGATLPLMVFGTRVLKYWVFGFSGQATHTDPWPPFSPTHAPAQKDSQPAAVAQSWAYAEAQQWGVGRVRLGLRVLAQQLLGISEGMSFMEPQIWSIGFHSSFFNVSCAGRNKSSSAFLQSEAGLHMCVNIRVIPKYEWYVATYYHIIICLQQIWLRNNPHRSRCKGNLSRTPTRAESSASVRNVQSSSAIAGFTTSLL